MTARSAEIQIHVACHAADHHVHRVPLRALMVGDLLAVHRRTEFGYCESAVGGPRFVRYRSVWWVTHLPTGKCVIPTADAMKLTDSRRGFRTRAAAIAAARGLLRHHGSYLADVNMPDRKTYAAVKAYMCRAIRRSFA